MGNPPDNAVQDRLQRPLQDLRLSVIDRCNFRCPYCMPAEVFGPDFAFLPSRQLLGSAEMERLVRGMVALGVHKLRLTGGEPLLRKDIVEVVQRLASVEGLDDVALTTNGTRLERLAPELAAAGLQRVNISLDALDETVFGRMSGGHGKAANVLRAIAAAEACGLRIKVNTVVRKGMNESEILPLARYFRNRGITLRFIEFMDTGNHNLWDLKEVVSNETIRRQIAQEQPLSPVAPAAIGEVARRYRYDDGSAELGFISSVTQPFCGNCVRARVSADGKLFTCLFAESGYDLRPCLDETVAHEDRVARFRSLWQRREDRYSEMRAQLRRKHPGKAKVEMSYIGG